MPWCDTCDRFLSPNTVNPDGTCPSCGRPVDPAATASRSASPAAHLDEEPVRAPWHFWVLIVGVVLYLGWRLIDGVGWVTGWY